LANKLPKHGTNVPNHIGTVKDRTDAFCHMYFFFFGGGLQMKILNKMRGINNFKTTKKELWVILISLIILRI